MATLATRRVNMSHWMEWKYAMVQEELVQCIPVHRFLGAP